MTSAYRVMCARVPMARPFDHAAKRRTTAESVLVRIARDGIVGWGEGAPREYVTGETIAATLDTLAALDVAMLDDLVPSDRFEAGVEALADLDLPLLIGGGTSAPSAAAAIETALLDILCRRHDRTFGDVLAAAGLPADRRRQPATVPISLVIDLSRTPAAVWAALGEPARSELRHVKVKATIDPAQTVERLVETRRLFGADVAISLDINGAWSVPQVEAVAEDLQELDLAWIEEPTTPGAWPDLRRLVARGIPIMLDESIWHHDQLALAARTGAAQWVNIRVSKCGGPLRAALLASAATDAGLGFQIGVQVGEVGPLWMASRALGTTLTGAITVEAGRQDEWFPEPLTSPPYSVDRAAYRADPVPGSGLGAVPTPALLANCQSVRD
jgi:L-Ala-D/L-Glu epimerase